jgi:hypothetical protein
MCSPASHVPPFTPSLGVPSPTHRGHGLSTGPVYRLVWSGTAAVSAPCSTSTLPVTAAVTCSVRQVPTPPAFMLVGAVVKNAQRPAPQGASSWQVIAVSLVQRWFVAIAFGINPVIVQTPHVLPFALGQLAIFMSSVHPSTGFRCEYPLQPASRLAAPDGVNATEPGHVIACAPGGSATIASMTKPTTRRCKRSMTLPPSTV